MNLTFTRSLLESGHEIRCYATSQIKPRAHLTPNHGFPFVPSPIRLAYKSKHNDSRFYISFVSLDSKKHATAE
jgi:hypothetical protein